MLTLKSRSSGKTMGDRHDDMTSCPQLRIVSADASPNNHGSRTPRCSFVPASWSQLISYTKVDGSEILCHLGCMQPL